MPVQFVAEKIRTDREGNDVIAFSFKPPDGGEQPDCSDA